MFNKKLAIVGASGAVGRVFLELLDEMYPCLLYTSPSPRDVEESRMPACA